MTTATNKPTNKPMTKTQVVSHFADKFSLPKKTAAEIVDEFSALAIAQTKKKGEFTLPGIGKLVKAKRKARLARNPSTGEQIKVPAKTVIKLRPSKLCREAIVSK
ncbi:MAG: HU family DNA-binding protein [Pseudomonadota bacterium]